MLDWLHNLKHLFSLFFILTLLSFSVSVSPPPGEFVTTTTEQPPIQSQSVYMLSENAVIVDGVPAFRWYRGCTPTAMAIVLAYWDIQGYDVLPTVDYAMFQSEAMNEAIASAEHWNNYAQPLDEWGNLKPDKSELPEGDEHTDNSIADCLKTSQSAVHLPYGWTQTFRIRGCLEQYSNTETLTGYTSRCRKDCWSFLVEAIEAERPVVMTVFSPLGMHTVAGVGYDEGYYGALNTWEDDVAWYPYSDCVGLSEWCVIEIFSLRIESSQPVTPVEPFRVRLPVVWR